MWDCPNCGESIEDRFDVCPCGTSQSGEKHPAALELEKLEKEWMEEFEQHHSSVPRLKRRQFVGWLALMAGMALALVGVWLHSLGEDVRLERLLHPWPWVCIGTGTLAVLTWAVFLLATGSDRRKIREHDEAAQSYGWRFERLLQDFEASREKDDEQ
jgi:hypothetical protein